MKFLIPRRGEKPAGRSADAVRPAAVHDRDGLGRNARRGLPPAFDRIGTRNRAPDGDRRPREPGIAERVRPVGIGQPERTRSVRFFRHPLYRAPRYAPAVPAQRLGRLSVPQGLQRFAGRQSGQTGFRRNARHGSGLRAERRQG